MVIYYIILFFSGVIIAVASLVLVFLLATLVVLVWTRVPSVNTPQKYYEVIFKELEMGPRMVVMDLGCGDGGFLLEAAKYNTKKCIGYEISPWSYLKAVAGSFFYGRGKVYIRMSDFLKMDLAEADVVYIFLVGSILGEVSKKLKKELKKGAQVVCLGFPLPGWEPRKTVDLRERNLGESKIYFYRV